MKATKKAPMLQPGELIVKPGRMTPVERADAADRKARAQKIIAKAAKGIAPALRQELVHLNGQLDSVMHLSAQEFFARRRAARGK